MKWWIWGPSFSSGDIHKHLFIFRKLSYCVKVRKPPPPPTTTSLLLLEAFLHTDVQTRILQARALPSNPWREASALVLASSLPHQPSANASLHKISRAFDLRLLPHPGYTSGCSRRKGRMLPTGHAEASAMHWDWSWIPQPWEGTCRQAELQEQIYDCGTPHTLLVGSRVGPCWELAFTRSLTEP